MEKRIELEKRGRGASLITELCLDDTRSTTIEGLTDEFVNLKTLSMNNVGLTRLKGFPHLPNLKHLEMSDNRISGGLDVLTGSPNLTHLNLSGNKISDLEALEPLMNFKQLKHLDLYNNGVTSVPKYREKVFKLIPSLEFLDGVDIDGKDAPDSEASGDDEDDEDDDFIEDDGNNGIAVLAKDEDEEDDEEDEDFQAGEEEEGSGDDEEEDDDDEDDDDDDEDDEHEAGADEASEGDVANGEAAD